MTGAPSPRGSRPARTRGDVVLALVVYVLPLLLVSGLLARAGLGGLALALLAVEAVVAGVTLRARRAPERTVRAGPSPRPWLVPLAMAGVLAAVLATAVLGTRLG